jgi:hypothetical protein
VDEEYGPRPKPVETIRAILALPQTSIDAVKRRILLDENVPHDPRPHFGQPWLRWLQERPAGNNQIQGRAFNLPDGSYFDSGVKTEEIFIMCASGSRPRHAFKSFTQLLYASGSDVFRRSVAVGY